MTEFSISERERSYYRDHAANCKLCGRPMDHPPIRMAIKQPHVVTKGEGKAMATFVEYPEVLACRWCVLEALAPLDEPEPSNERAGWWHRAILQGDFEPRGATPEGKSSVDEKVGPAEEVRQGNSESD